jgi:hypothetical protein
LTDDGGDGSGGSDDDDVYVEEYMTFHCLSDIKHQFTLCIILSHICPGLVSCMSKGRVKINYFYSSMIQRMLPSFFSPLNHSFPVPPKRVFDSRREIIRKLVKKGKLKKKSRMDYSST